MKSERERELAIKTGDTVEFMVEACDVKLKGIVLGVDRSQYYGFCTFSVWSEDFGGQLVSLPIKSQPFFRAYWKLLERPTTYAEARERYLVARASYERRVQEEEALLALQRGAQARKAKG
jgi:hypothetical protein